MWFAIVGKRTATARAPDAVALREARALEQQRLVVAEAVGGSRSTARAPSSFSSSPASVTWPPPSGVERRLASFARKSPSPSSSSAPIWVSTSVFS